jgi:protein TonB
MSRSFVERPIRATLFCAAAAVGALVASAACAADTPARVDMMQPHPQDYPDSAQVSGEEGAVLVSVYVRPNGRAGKVRVDRSSGFDDLDTAAVQSVLNWRFVPATRDGDQISDWTAVKVVYQLPRLPQPATPPPPG